MAASNQRRQMHLGLFWLGTGDHAAGWRWEGAFTSGCNWSFAQQGAMIAERGKLDLFFIADGLSTTPVGDHPSFMTRLEPITLAAGLALTTRHIGIGATVSTTFSQPYTVARQFLSLQHMSGGRAGWNVVTSSSGAAAANHSMERLHDHDKRYEIANEFVDVVRGLWRTWEAGAVIADKESGAFIDPSKVRPLDHKGRYFSVKGPLNMESSPYGPPCIIQAGGSPPGQDLSARTADVVFSVVNGDKASAKANYDSLKALVVEHGREPHSVKILPGIMPIVGRSDADAREQLARLQSWLSPTNAIELVSQRLGHDISKYPFDGPVPDLPLTQAGQAFSRTLLEMARREKMTLRDLYNVTAAARGHWVVAGSPKRVADVMEEWFCERLADGFVIMPAWFPGAFDVFVDQVVPELQRRGIYRNEYTGATMRHHFGLE